MGSLFGSNKPVTQQPPQPLAPIQPLGSQGSAFGQKQQYGSANPTAVSQYNASGSPVNYLGQDLSKIPGTAEYMQGHGQSMSSGAPMGASGFTSTSLGSAFGAGSGASLSGGSSVPGGITSTAAPDPRLNAAADSYAARIKDLMAHQSDSNGVDVARGINQAQGQISDAAEGGNNALSLDLARRGVAGGGDETQGRRQISENSQRMQAGAAANMTLAGQKAQSDLNQSRAQQINALMGGSMQAAAAPAQLALSQQGLGLEQLRIQQAAQNAEADRQAAAAARTQGLYAQFLQPSYAGGGY